MLACRRISRLPSTKVSGPLTEAPPVTTGMHKGGAYLHMRYRCGCVKQRRGGEALCRGEGGWGILPPCPPIRPPPRRRFPTARSRPPPRARAAPHASATHPTSHHHPPP